jgi:SpoVK/Ycf46/Vps4 family AAA+-type ATPase
VDEPVDLIRTVFEYPTSDLEPGKPSDKGDISTRPGRIDRVVPLTALDTSARFKIARRILEDCPDQIDRLVHEGDGDSGAQFQSRCERVALTHYWSGEKNGYSKASRTRIGASS